MSIERWDRCDTKIGLTFIIWFPLILLGWLAGFAFGAFKGGFCDGQKALDEWFNKSLGEPQKHLKGE